jgi:hypothetical protein
MGLADEKKADWPSKIEADFCSFAFDCLYLA